MPFAVGHVVSEETREKLRLGRLGKKQPEEMKQKLSAAKKGHSLSPERRGKIVASLIGRKHSEDTKRKIRESNLGQKRTPDQIENNRRARIGKPSPRKGTILSEGTKQKVRDARANQVHPRFSVRGITQSDIDAATAKGLRWCAGNCKDFVPVAQFYKNGNTKRTVCSDCAVSLTRGCSYKKYGIGPEWYESTLEAQGGKCALCPVVASNRISEGANGGPRRWRLAIDHDHDTGAARGLLCTRCNMALHSVEYVEGWAARATEYLIRNGSKVGKGKQLSEDGTPVARTTVREAPPVVE